MNQQIICLETNKQSLLNTIEELEAREESLELVRLRLEVKIITRKLRRLNGKGGPIHEHKNLEDAMERFNSYTVKSDGCWGLSGPKHNCGYGVFSVGNEHMFAHRFSAMMHIGPIPIKMETCHKCDNPPCSNPAHLFIGTHQQNILDAASKGKMGPLNPTRGESSPLCRFTERHVRAIRLYPDSVMDGEIASVFGMTRANVRSIRSRRTWSHV